jgi:hypothetical protein
VQIKAESIEFKVGNHVSFKVKSRLSSLKLGNCSKLAARYYGPFEILERIGHVAYMFELPASLCIHNVFNLSLITKCVPPVNHIIDWNVIQVEPEVDFLVRPVCILHQKIKQLWNKFMELVKVQWTWYNPEDETWEHEDAMQIEYPHCF